MPKRQLVAARAAWAAGPVIAVLLTTLVAGCSAAPSVEGSAPARTSATAPPSAGRYPDSIAVIGHSGATGFDSDPAARGTDARQNSWATGTNPAVHSIYLRLLAVDPAIAGHATNVAVAGSDVTALSGQIDEALRARPVPQLFLVQSVDNDMRCDGTDDDNYAPFEHRLTAALQRIERGAPGARILIVSSPWATAANYAAVAAQSDEGRSANTGPGPCDAFDPSGRPQPSHVRYVEAVTQHYLARVAASCRAVPSCRYDGGALHAMRITAADVTPDFDHLSIQGQAKQAAVEWALLEKELAPGP